MSSILQKVRANASKGSTERRNTQPTVVRTEYISKPIPIPDEFLAPITDPSTIEVKKIDFAKTDLSEYKNLYAVILDNVLSQEECDQLLYLAEQSAGAHTRDGEVGNLEEEVEDSGWKPALVNAGRNYEVWVPEYRNSDRIIWDQKTVVKRIWDRVLQGQGMKEYLLTLEGKKYLPIVRTGEKWLAIPQGLNERMRFLRYGPGQYFREHCDSAYSTEDGSQQSFFTIHVYLNDSAQALGYAENDRPEMLRGGATAFHSIDAKHRLDINPKAGRVLIFQHRRLLHSGEEVTAGVKYTMRSDLMYEMTEPAEAKTGGIVFK